MKKKLRRLWFYIRYRLLFDIRYGEGRFGEVYVAIGKHFNPIKPWFWQKTKPPQIDFELADDQGKIVPCAYWTGDGWDLHWGVMCHDKVSGYSFPEALSDEDPSLENFDDYQIYEWPFFLPYATSKDLEKAGFKIV